MDLEFSSARLLYKGNISSSFQEKSMNSVMEEEDEVPLFFRCPISMEIMEDPVIICTGITYDRKNIQKWFFQLKKNTCPTTMQIVTDFNLTPNQTLKNLMISWPRRGNQSVSCGFSEKIDREELESLINTIESTPFKFKSLKKLRLLIDSDYKVQDELLKFGGIEILGNIVLQILIENFDFNSSQSCEEALGIFNKLPLTDAKYIKYLMDSQFIKSLVKILQKGSDEGRLNAIDLLKKIVKIDPICKWLTTDLSTDVLQSLIELISDEISCKSSSLALDVLIEITSPSKKHVPKLIETGAIRVLIELLPDSNRSKCEKILLLIKNLCECAEGRYDFSQNPLAIPVITTKILRVSHTATKIGVKIFWLMCSHLPTEKILEEMIVFGSLKKLLVLLHIIEAGDSSKEMVIKIIKLHGKTWKRHRCSPIELNDYLKLLFDSR